MDLPPAAPSEPDPAPAQEPPPPPALPRRIRRRDPLVAAILGWVIPGLGQVYAGRPGKALVLAATIGGLFYAGWAMTGFTGVDPDTYLLHFVAHACLGGPTAWAFWSSRSVELVEAMPYLETGLLYSSVAGLLNVVAICDALGCVLEHNVRAEDRSEERRAMRERYETMLEELEAARVAAAAEATADAMALEGERPDVGSGFVVDLDPEGTA